MRPIHLAILESAVQLAAELGLMIDGELIGDPAVDEPVIFEALPESDDNPSIPNQKATQNR